MLQWVSVATSYLYADLVAALLDSSPTRGDERIVADLDLLDRRLGDVAFLAGSTLSCADLIVAPMIGFARDRTAFDLSTRPSLARWWRTVSDRASFRETAA
jgi:glutathione S-transferase